MAKTEAKSPFEGLWHIVSMDTWDEDYFNEEVQAFIEFEANGTGHFQFGYVSGYMDWRPANGTGSPPSSGPGRETTALTARSNAWPAATNWRTTTALPAARAT